MSFSRAAVKRFNDDMPSAANPAPADYDPKSLGPKGTGIALQRSSRSVPYSPKKTQQLTIHYSFYSVTTLTELHTMTLTCNVRFSTHKEFTPGPGQYDVSAVSTVKKGSIVNSSRYYTTDGNILTVWGVRLLKMFG